MLEIVNLRPNIHGHARLRSAIGEEKRVFIGGSNGIRLLKGGERRRREIAESEEMERIVRLEDAEVGVLLDLEEDLEKRLLGEEKEAETRRYRIWSVDGGGD